jgi:putative ABC transport system ATP-binding protein
MTSALDQLPVGPPTSPVPAPGAGNAAAVTVPVIAVRKVSKVYGAGEAEVHALHEVTLTIEQGDFVAIMGASGSGKSTLMNILGCLDTPSNGRYWLAGTDVSTLRDDDLADIRNRRIGFVFQSFNLIPRTTALANVELPLIYAGVKRVARRTRATQALSIVGLDDRLGHHPSQLSGGQQQRVAIARALVTNPAMILADEPTGALDSASTAEVLGIFDSVNASGRTVIVITHEDEVARHAKRVVRLRDGVIMSDDRQGPLRGRPPLAPARPALSAGGPP